MNWLIRFSIINFFIFLVAINYFSYKSQKQTSFNIVTRETPVNIPTPPLPVKKNSTKQLSEHNNANDCWVSYGGSVYNVTPFINLHPGGPDLIIKYCGRDITLAFNTKDKSPPKPHTEAALKILFSFLVPQK